MHHTNMRDHMATVGGRYVTAGPGACKRFDIHMDPLMTGQHTISLELLAAANKSAPILTSGVFTPLMPHHFRSSVASELALLVVALELAMFVVLVVVNSHYGMSLETAGTLATSPLGSVGVVSLEVSIQQFARKQIKI